MKTFVVDDERLALRDRVRALLDDECTPAHVRASDSGGGWSWRRWKALASIGVAGLTLPSQFGGSERDETWVVLVLEEAGRAALPESLGAAWVAGALLADVGSDEQRERWLPAIAAGDAVAAASLPGRQEVDDADIADVILLGEGREVHAFPREAVQMTPAPTTDGSRRFAITATVNARSCLAVRAAGIIALASDRATLAEAALLLGTADKLVSLAGTSAQDLENAAAAVEAARSEVYAAAWSVATDSAGRTAAVKMARTLAGQAAGIAGRAAVAQQGKQSVDKHDLDLWLRLGLAASTTAER